MLGWMFRLFVVCVMFLGLTGAFALAGHADRWPIALGGAVACYVVAAFAVKRLAFKLFCAPFKAKGAVLRGATVEVHSIRRAPVMALVAAGSAESGEGQAMEGRRPDWRYFDCDVTVTPTGECNGPFMMWAPGELRAVPVDASPEPRRGHDDAEDLAAIENVEVFSENEWRADEGMSYPGGQRVRFTLGAAPIVTVAKLAYYFEGMGRLELPGDGT